MRVISDGGADLVDLSVREGVDVPEHLGAQHRAKALAGPRRTVLADQRAAKAHQTQQHHHAAHPQHIAAVAIGDADVDDLRHD